MSRPIVADSSVAIKWLLPEEHDARASELLDPSIELHAPDLMPLEVAAALCQRCRRKEVSAGEVHRLRGVLARMPVTLHRTIGLLDPAVELSLLSGVAVYDCVFLTMAQTLDCPCVTADQRLVRMLAGSALGGRAVWIGRWSP